jgi:tRNA(Ile)-lysidine synthase
MIDQMQKTLLRYRMIEPGEGVVVGVSGGPDSLALLHGLIMLRENWPMRLVAVHVHHGLRGADADADADFVRDFCMAYEVPFYLFEADVGLQAKLSGISFEMEGRRVRYEAFEKVCEEEGCSKIAIAQNMNDQCETVLMRLFRGAGLDGLGGIQPVRDDKFIRPLIETPRQKIEQYCEAHDLSPRLDHTNFEPDYERNRIRLELIPYLEKQFNPRVSETLSRTAALLREEASFLEGITQEAFEASQLNFEDSPFKDLDGRTQGPAPEKSAGIRLDDFSRMHPALRKRLIRKLAQTVSGVLSDFSQSHVEAVESLTSSHEGTKRFYAGSLEVLRVYDTLWMRRAEAQRAVSLTQEGDLDAAVDESDLWKIQIREVDRDTWLEIKNDPSGVAVDMDKLDGVLTVRYRRAGDRFKPFGMQGYKTMKRFMVDEKIPETLRNKIPLVCDEKKIIWVYGYRMSEEARIEAGTNRIGWVTLVRRH